MRILFFFFKLALFCGTLGILVYFFGGTLWLKIGSYGLQQDVEQLPRYFHNISIYNKLCQESPQSSENSVPFAFQLRFLDDRVYALELVCTLIESSPIELKRGSLPPFIARAPGSAGFSYPIAQPEDSVSAIRLRSLNKEIGMQLSGDAVSLSSDIHPIVGLYPRAECASFGYQCCSQGSQAGKGALMTGPVTDCASTCFASCSNLPFVELFNSDPPYEQETREIEMPVSTLDVVFNYGVNPKTVKNVHISFGDGQEQDSPLADGIFSHTYTCDGPCTYTASLTTIDGSGVSSVETSQSKIYIVKR